MPSRRKRSGYDYGYHDSCDRAERRRIVDSSAGDTLDAQQNGQTIELTCSDNENSVISTIWKLFLQVGLLAGLHYVVAQICTQCGIDCDSYFQKVSEHFIDGFLINVFDSSHPVHSLLKRIQWPSKATYPHLPHEQTLSSLDLKTTVNKSG